MPRKMPRKTKKNGPSLPVAGKTARLRAQRVNPVAAARHERAHKDRMHVREKKGLGSIPRRIRVGPRVHPPQIGSPGSRTRSFSSPTFSNLSDSMPPSKSFGLSMLNPGRRSGSRRSGSRQQNRSSQSGSRQQNRSSQSGSRQSRSRQQSSSRQSRSSRSGKRR